MTIASIPSTLSPGLAPPGKHLVHAYTAGNEPYEIWEGLDRRSPEYKRLKVHNVLLRRGVLDFGTGMGGACAAEYSTGVCSACKALVGCAWCSRCWVSRSPGVVLLLLKLVVPVICMRLVLYEIATPLWLQEERAEVLWSSLERVIPDIRARAEVVQIGARGPCCVLITLPFPPPALCTPIDFITQPCRRCAGAALYYQGLHFVSSGDTAVAAPMQGRR